MRKRLLADFKFLSVRYRFIEPQTPISKMIMDIKLTIQGTNTFELVKSPTNLSHFIEGIIEECFAQQNIILTAEFNGEINLDKNYF